MPRRNCRHNQLVKACVTTLNLTTVAGHRFVAWPNDTGRHVQRRADGSWRAKKPYGTRGVSDILGFITPSGQFLAVEVKTGNGRPTDAQREFASRVIAGGGLALVVRDSVQDLLDQLHDLLEPAP